ncbi:folate-binding protein YgfZ [Oscillatoriales cyanobacterium LEGE 11467]|uniref:Folate-binding protein YgfZ n=1 Tax=Zarconia navalis LEGE 11467 TaxID=1828826 RepID=A0A928ZAK7_9CYAN|nr:folate-binding protein [Zarconia navalis]MBE9041786.1 folate-binding protein YgfZ [Zarconia navalis LEGE 11467]
MTQELQEVQTTAGASFGEVFDASVPVSFGNDAIALKAAKDGAALYDRSHWGKICLWGDDRTRFLHNQSTNDFNSLKPGQTCETVFLTSTARTLDLATAYILDDAIWLLVSPNRTQKLIEWFDRYLFPMDKVDVEEIAETTNTFSLIGEKSHTILANLGITLELEENTHQLVQLADVEVRLATGNGLATAGYTLFCPAEDAAKVWQQIADAGAVPLGETAWEQLRIGQGRPLPDAELTEDYNPLEAGLWQTISFEKGCYIGQETIARLNTYQGVKTQLWGIRLAAPEKPGAIVLVGEEKVGQLTSVVETDDGAIGLAYIRTKAGGAGLEVKVEETVGKVVDVPFLTRGYLD